MSEPERAMRFVLEGGGRLQDVPAEDVANFILGVVRIVQRAAGHAVQRPVKQTGRREAIVESASRVRLQRVRSGSVAVWILPSHHEEFVIGDNLGLDAETVSERALMIARDAAGLQAERYPDVAAGWMSLAADVGLGERYERVVIARQGERRRVTLDITAVDRLGGIVRGGLHPTSEETVRGVLYEANFEALSAKLRTGTNDVVEVRFDLDQAVEIKRELREATELEGEVTLEPRTNRITSIHVRRIERPEQLRFREFWAAKSVPELIAEQGIAPVTHPDELSIERITDADWTAFREALGIEA